MKQKMYTISTLGSHSSLQILKGARDEGFRTLLVCEENKKSFYSKFPFIDRILTVRTFSELPLLEETLIREHCIIIPHGSFVAYLGVSGNKNLRVPYFGNKKVLDWEENRNKQRTWLTASSVRMPREFVRNSVTYPVIIKTFGAAGGAGYFFAADRHEFNSNIRSIENHRYVIQEYIIGVTCYMHYFYSPLTGSVELMSIDRRYESNADALGRIPPDYQSSMKLQPSYVVVGNSPLVLRESLLPEAYAMGERVVAASRALIDPKGLVGPFCLETLITPDQKFYTMEISCRIVAGTNLFTQGSPYSYLTYDEPMSTGRRIAREIKLALQKNMLDAVIQ